MISLPHGCTCSNLTVTPKDWKTCKASALHRNWHIQYYFYHPGTKERKFVLVKGMNRFKSLSERREATQQLIENEWRNLKEKGCHTSASDNTDGLRMARLGTANLLLTEQ